MANERARNAAFAVFRPGKFLQNKADQKEAERNRADAERFRQEGVDLVNQLNWEPDYVSDIMPAYQRAQSPVARAFLESMLTGTNPSSISPTRHGANRLRAGAQAGFDRQFGGWDDLLRQQREAEQATPWAPGKFTAPAVQKLPPREQPQDPPWLDAVRRDPNGQTEEGAAAIQDMWGLGPDSDYWDLVEDAVGRPVPRTVSGSRR